MAEYIDLDTPLELYVDRGGFYRQQITSLRELLNINKIPYIAADVRSVIRGKWKTVMYHLYECSECGAAYQDVGYGFNYCPNCGARMDGEEDV